MFETVAWLTQNVTLPLYAVLVLFVLPVGYFGRIFRRVIEQRLPDGGREKQ